MDIGALRSEATNRLRFAAVSTFNRAGLDLYGRRMIWSFEEHWPADVGLTVYSEGWSEPIDRARVLDLETASPWLAAFKARHGIRSIADFRKDAVRFSHKVAALCHVAGETDADVLIWMDGDVVTHAPVTLGDLAGMAPSGDEWIAWLDRARKYPECGFYLLNCRHPQHRQMIRCFDEMYSTDALFSLPEWHDSFVLEHVVKAARVATKSLSGNARNTGHPAEHGPLNRWIKHLKGRRKFAA